MNFSIEDFFSKCGQISRKLRIWSHLLKKSLIENFIFCAVTNHVFLRTFHSLPDLKIYKLVLFYRGSMIYISVNGKLQKQIPEMTTNYGCILYQSFPKWNLKALFFPIVQNNK